MGFKDSIFLDNFLICWEPIFIMIEKLTTQNVETSHRFDGLHFCGLRMSFPLVVFLGLVRWALAAR